MSRPKDLVTSSSRLRPLAAALVVSLGLGGAAVAYDAREIVVISEPVSTDLYAAGRSVDVRADVDGDVTVAGQSVTVSGVVTGDVLGAAETMVLAGDFRDDIRVAARSVTLSGHVADHVVAAGETVVFSPSSRVTGFTWAAGNYVELGGEIGGDVRAAGQNVTISGTVGGDAEIDAASAVIGQGAHIRGDLVWPRGQAPDIRPGARIDGRQIERAAEGFAAERKEPYLGVIGGVLLGALSLLLLTWLLRVAMPPVMSGAAGRLRLQPGRSFGFGVLALLVAPIAAFVAMVTVIGVPLGIVVLLGYVVLLMISVPVALLSLTDLVVERLRTKQRPSSGTRFGILALMTVVFVVLMQIPVVSWLVGLAAIIFGLGGLVLRAFRRREDVVVPPAYVPPGPVPPAPVITP